MSGDWPSNADGLQAPVENESQVHALLIDHVLDKIFGYVADDLRSTEPDFRRGAAITARICKLRPVCKLWKERATALLRDRYPKMSFGTYLGPFMGIRWHSTSKVQEFVDVMRESDMIPYTSYSFREDIFSLRSSQLFEEFLGVVSSSVKELDISINLSEVDGLRPTPNWNENLKMGELQNLKVYINQPEDLIIPKKCEISYFVGFLLVSAPALEEFVYHPSSERNCDDGLDYILARIPKSVEKLDVEVYHGVSNLHWNALLLADLKLEYFELYSEALNCDTYNKFFATQVNSLTDLRLWGDSSKILSVDFPKMSKLKNLSVSGKLLSSSTSVSIADTFPVLTRLDCDCDVETLEAGFARLLQCNTRPISSVKELYLPEELPDLQCIKKAKKCFPNVKKLTFHLGPRKNYLEEVFFHFAEIEELHIVFSENWTGTENVSVDSLLSGVSKGVCEDIIHKGNYSEVILKEIQTKPSILHLTKLKSLHLRKRDHFTIFSDTVTDFVAHHFLLKVASLEELFMDASHLNRQNKEALIAKLKKFEGRCRLGRHGYFEDLGQH